ncbi:MAG: hypothetical protein R2729_28205 [Bryobacteraceae bacterium]
MKTITWTLLFAATCAWGADFSYTETTEMTGGSMKRLMGIAAKFGGKSGPQRTTHHISGSKMSSDSGDTRTIMDLAAETLTSVDFKKKEYSTITFAEMAEAAQAMMAKMKGSKKDNGINMKWKVSVDRTGKRAPISGIDCEQAILSMETEATATDEKKQSAMFVSTMKVETWHGKPEGWEVAQKVLRELASKMAMGDRGMAPMLAQLEGGMEGMREASKELAKMDGLAMRSISRMMGAGFGSPEGGSTQSSEAKTPEAREAAAEAVLGRLGGFGRFGRKKPKEQPKQEEPAKETAAAPSGDGVLMEMTTEVVSYSIDPVDPAQMSVPAGFKEVEHPMRKMLDKQKQ